MLLPQMGDKRAVQNTMACCYPFVMVGPRQRPCGSLMRVGSPQRHPGWAAAWQGLVALATSIILAPWRGAPF